MQIYRLRNRLMSAQNQKNSPLGANSRKKEINNLLADTTNWQIRSTNL